MIKIQPSRGGYDSTCNVDEIPQQGEKRASGKKTITERAYSLAEIVEFTYPSCKTADN